MKKLIVILLLMATTACGLDYAFIKDTILTGGEATQYDLVVAYLNADGARIDTVTGLERWAFYDSVSGTYDGYNNMFWEMYLINSDVYGIDTVYYRIPVILITDYINIGAPSDPAICSVFYYFYSPSGQPREGGTFTATLLGDDVRDACNNTTMHGYSVTSPPSDNTGLAKIGLIKSKCLTGIGKYRIKGEWNGEFEFRTTITVPDQDTLRITR